MNWDYDKLFAEGNVIGVKSNSSDTFLTSAVDCDNIKDWKSAYGNEKLSNGVGDILWIVRLNENGEVAERVFDRERDFPKPMPELKTGMFVEVHEDVGEYSLGVVAGDKIFYQKSGWDHCTEYDDTGLVEGLPECYITAVWSEDTLGFDMCKAGKAIWRK